MSSIRNRLAGRWRLVSYEASPERGDPVFPLGATAAGVLDCSDEGNMSDRDLAGASGLCSVALEGARLVLSGSMDFEGKAHTVRVVWERQAE